MDPLKLTAFDHLMLADDRPEYPMRFFLRARLDGPVVVATLQAAAAEAVRRHPLLAARVSGGDARSRAGRLAWQAAGTGMAFAVSADATPPDGHERLDPYAAPPLRLALRGASLWLEVHHAAADAIGAAQLLEDILICYARLAGAPLPLRPLDTALLRGRGDFHGGRRERRQRLWANLARIGGFFRRFPAPLAPAAGEPVPRADAPFPAAAALTLGPDELDGLRREAHRHGATVNDLLLAELFRAADRWNRAQGASRPVRIAMPINMRRAADRAMPAANVVSMCFLDRRGAALDGAELLQSVARETRAIKRYRLGHALILVAETLGRLPRGLKLLMTPRRPWDCSASIVLSNLGNPFSGSVAPRDARGRLRFGPLTLDAVELLPPIRPQTRAAIGVVQYAGGLTLSLHHDARWLSAAAARAFLNGYAAALRESMAAAAAASLPFADRLAASRERQRSERFRALPIGKNVGHGHPRDEQGALPAAP